MNHLSQNISGATKARALIICMKTNYHTQELGTQSIIYLHDPRSLYYYEQLIEMTKEKIHCLLTITDKLQNHHTKCPPNTVNNSFDSLFMGCHKIRLIV